MVEPLRGEDGELAGRLFEAGDRALIITDRRGVIRRANRRARRMWGPRVAGGRAADALVDEMDRPRLRGAFDDWTGAGSRRLGSVRLICLGRVDVASVWLHDLPEDEGGMLVAVGSAATVERVAADDETDEVVHDLRNLIFPVIGQLDLALDSVEPASVAYRSLLAAQTACQQCEQMLRKLEARARPRSETVPAAGGDERVVVVNSDVMLRDILESHLRSRGYDVAAGATLADVDRRLTSPRAADAVVLDAASVDAAECERVARRAAEAGVPHLIVCSGAKTRLPHGRISWIIGHYRMSEVSDRLRRALDEPPPRGR